MTRPRLGAGWRVITRLMARPRHLRKAPIVEAVVDFRVALAPDFSPEDLRAAKERLSRHYPKVSEKKRFSEQVEFVVGKGASHQTQDLGMLGLFLKSEDEKTIAQFRVDGFTLNRLKPYTSWKKLGPEALRLWAVYAALTKPRVITRVALRYINHMALPATGLLEDYLLTVPALPSGIPRHLTSFRTRTVLENPKTGLTATIAQVFGPNTEAPVPVTEIPGHALLFDIDAYKAGHFTMDTDFKAILEDLHTYKNRIFFGSLTNRFVKTFEK